MAYLNRSSPIPLTGKGSRLLGKQLAFIDEYFVDLNASAAVLRAGYKTKNPTKIGTDLMAHPLIEREIERRQKERTEKTELKAEFIINKLIAIVEDTEKANPNAALRGLELLGKTLALFKERQEISGPDGAAIEYEQRVKEDVADLESAIARLAGRDAKTGVAIVPDEKSTRKA